MSNDRYPIFYADFNIPSIPREVYMLQSLTECTVTLEMEA
jgi:hypothetical protein